LVRIVQLIMHSHKEFEHLTEQSLRVLKQSSVTVPLKLGHERHLPGDALLLFHDVALGNLGSAFGGFHCGHHESGHNGLSGRPGDRPLGASQLAVSTLEVPVTSVLIWIKCRDASASDVRRP
jgi:hypothetical protein